MSKYFFSINLLIFFSLFAPHLVSAASLFANQNQNVLEAGKTLNVDVLIDTDEPVDTLGGELSFDPKVLEFVRAEDAGSAINFWTEYPHLTNPGEIVFSGMSPGGLGPQTEKLFTLSFVVRAIGDPKIALKDSEVFFHDGTGDAHSLAWGGMRLRQDDSHTAVSDTEPPEAFSIFLSSSPEMFEGASFISFATGDKGSGIDHYEVREGEFGFFTRATSPFVLRDQNLTRTIFVKAIDLAGNERLVERAPEHITYPWQRGVLLSILIYIIITLIWKRFSK